MNLMMPFSFAFLLLLQSSLSQTVRIAQRLQVKKGSCRFFLIYYKAIPSNTFLTFSGWDRSLLTIKPDVFSFNETLWYESKKAEICSINTNASEQKTPVNYYFTSQNQKYSHDGNNFLIVDIYESKHISNLNDVAWENQNKKGNYADFMVDTPGNSGTLYYTISGFQANFNYALFFLQRCKILEQYCSLEQAYYGSGYSFSVYRNLTQRSTTTQTQASGKQISNYKTRVSFNYDLIEATTYQICSFYRDSQSYKQSNISCFNFSTDSSQSFISVRFKFTSRISFIKLNAFLCFMVNYLGTHMRDIITNDGYSCYINLNQQIQPFNYYYQSPGPTIRLTNQTILYINQHEKNHLLRSNYERIWNYNQNLSTKFRGLLEQYNITWIESGRNLGLKSTSQMLNNSKGIGLTYQATYSVKLAGQDKKNVTFNFSITNCQEVGALRFTVIVFELGIEYKQFYNEMNVMQCNRGYSEFSGAINSYCYRFILTGKPQKPLYSVINLVIPSTATFKVFSYETNEYPRFPIIVKKISQVKFKEQSKEGQNETVQEEQKNKAKELKVEKGTVFNMGAFYLVIYLILAHL